LRARVGSVVTGSLGLVGGIAWCVECGIVVEF
jgi:hypothetical protein